MSLSMGTIWHIIHTGNRHWGECWKCWWCGESRGHNGRWGVLHSRTLQLPHEEVGEGESGGGGSNPLTPGKLRFWLIFRTSKMAQAREVKNPKVVWTLSLLVWDWRKAKGPTTSRVETTSNWTMQLWSSWYTWKSIADRVPKQFYCLYTKAINNIF